MSQLIVANVMNEEKKIELEYFFDVSQKMLALAKNKDWEKLPELEVDRQKVMHSFFESEDSDHYLSINSDKVEHTIKNVLLINEQIEKIAQKEQLVIGQELQGLKKKQNAHSAYLENNK